MQACLDWVLIIFGTQVIKKKRPVRPAFPDYLSVSYDYGNTNPHIDIIGFVDVILRSSYFNVDFGSNWIISYIYIFQTSTFNLGKKVY